MGRPSTEDLEALVAVADAGSISRAASYTGVPRSTLSRRLDHLEASVGLPLVERTHRQIRLTAEGQRLLERARGLLQELDDTLAQVRSSDQLLRGTLRLATPLGLAPPQVARFLTDLHTRHPALRIQHLHSDQPPHALVDQVDVILTAQEVHTADWIARPLTTAPEGLFATPRYLAERGRPQGEEDLEGHALIGLRQGRDPTLWPLLGGGHLRVQPWLVSNDLDIARRALLDHGGLALMHRAAVAQELARGLVEPVLEDLIGHSGKLHVMYSAARRDSPVIQAWMAAMEEYLGGEQG